MTVMRDTTTHQACRILLVLTCAVLLTAGCSFLDTTNNSNTNNGSCNAAGGSNSVNCSSAPKAHPSAVVSTPTASSAPSALTSSAAAETWTETTYSWSETFADYQNAGDPLGAQLKPLQAVKVSCRAKGFAVADGDRWWYRLAQSPWDNRYYASTDNFYNTPRPIGNPLNGVVFDKRVHVC
jgi:hypothetical protein